MIQNICFQELHSRGVKNRSKAQWQNGTVAQFVTDSPTLHIVQYTFPEHARGRKHKAMSGSTFWLQRLARTCHSKFIPHLVDCNI
jgi:hypothetical protein